MEEEKEDTDITLAKQANLLEPPIACAIGHVIVHWSRLEDFLTYFIQQLLGLQHEPAAILYSETSSLQKANIVRALIAVTRDQDLIEEADILLAEYDRLREIRNDISHSIWGKLSEDDYVLHRTTAREYAKLKASRMNLLKLRETFTAIMNLMQLLNVYSSRLDARKAAEIIGREHEEAFRPRPPTKGHQDQIEGRLRKKERQARQAAQQAEAVAKKKSVSSADTASQKHNSPTEPT